jgi:hypothetical protein
MQDLLEAFEYMVDTETCVTTLQEADHYRWKHGTFSKDLAQKMAYDSNTSLGMFINLHIHYSSDSVTHFSLSFALQPNGGLCLTETHLRSRSYH